MTTTLFIWAAGIALAFVSWPILSSYSGAPGAWVGMLILIGSVIGNSVVGFRDITISPMFTWKAFAIIITAGIVNGIAVYYYGAKAADPNVPVGLFVAVMVIFMAIFAPFIDLLVKGTPISAQQVLGLTIIGFGIYLVKG